MVDVWGSLRSLRTTLARATARLSQQSAEVADLRLLCDELKSEAAAAWAEAASTRTKASSARELVASQAEEMQQRQLELGQVIGERDQSRSQAAKAMSRAEALRGQLAEATEQLAEASARAGALAADLAAAQAAASEQRARAGGMSRPFSVFVSACFLCLCLRPCVLAVRRARVRPR